MVDYMIIKCLYFSTDYGFFAHRLRRLRDHGWHGYNGWTRMTKVIIPVTYYLTNCPQITQIAQIIICLDG